MRIQFKIKCIKRQACKIDPVSCDERRAQEIEFSDKHHEYV